MDYFPHDTHAMSDDKVLALRIDAGLEAVACYWVVLEKIYADEKPFDTSETNVETKSVLLRLGIGFEQFCEMVSRMVDTGLLYRVTENPNMVMSERAEAQIETLEKKRETARQNGKNGGRKPKDNKRRNQRKTEVGSNGKPKSGDIKTENVIGFHKENLITGGCAGAGESAQPPDVKGNPVCPRCGSGTIGTNSSKPGAGGKKRHMFLCPDCYEEVWE